MIERLEWESEFFQRECAQFYPEKGKYDCEASKRYDWVQGKCLITDEESKSLFGSHKFVFEDTRIIFVKKVQRKTLQLPPSFSIGESDIKELPPLQRIARSELTPHSRLLVLMGEKETGRFYSEWVKKAILRTFDDISFTLRHQKKPIGFVTLKYLHPHAKIGIVAIDGRYQGKGLGRQLIQYAENHLHKRGYGDLQVITEGRNIKAQQFYIKYGFNIQNIECWYYRIHNRHPDTHKETTR